MFAVYAETFSADDPLSGLTVGERPDPAVPDGLDHRRRSGPPSLNHHDLWSLRGVGLQQDALPMILGCDAAGIDEDGNEVVVHAVIGDPSWTRRRDAGPAAVAAQSERYQGTFAEQVVVPAPQRGAQAGVAVLRGGGLPADRLADGVPDALHPGRPQARATRVLVQGPAAGWRPR